MTTPRMRVKKADRVRRAQRPDARGRNDREKPFSDLLFRLESSRNANVGAGIRAGEMVRRMRVLANLSQKQLGDAIGVTQARISELEAGLGKNGPSFAVLERIASACHAELAVVPKTMPRHEDRDVPLLIANEHLQLTPIAPLHRETVAREALSAEGVRSSLGSVKIGSSGRVIIPLSGSVDYRGTETMLVLEPVAIAGRPRAVRVWYEKHGIAEPTE
jgi:transcriptional regulator with XRE-family HTH domain